MLLGAMAVMVLRVRPRLLARTVVPVRTNRRPARKAASFVRVDNTKDRVDRAVAARALAAGTACAHGAHRAWLASLVRAANTSHRAVVTVVDLVAWGTTSLRPVARRVAMLAVTLGAGHMMRASVV